MRAILAFLRATATPSLLAVAVGAALLCAPAGAAGAVSPLPASDYSVRSECAAPSPGFAACLSLQLQPRTTAARAHTHPLGMTSNAPIAAVKATEGVFGLRPEDLQSAYFPSSEPAAPATQTIALVDAYNDPNAEADLNVYDKEFKLSACSAANGCFEQVNQSGQPTPLPFPESNAVLAAREATCENKAAGKAVREAACREVTAAKGWTVEISTDIEIAHAVCQLNCRILLVEATGSSYTNLDEAEKTAINLGATEVSNSWGGEEPLSDSEAFNHPGTVITASSGDNGYLNWDAPNSVERGFANYPASSPHVVAVGGTRLTLTSPANTWKSETVWNGDGASGGGCSARFGADPWQLAQPDFSGLGCSGVNAGIRYHHRAVADVSADADPYTGVAVYDSEPGEAGETWRTIGGTSVSSPIIASMFALAGGAQGVAYPARTLYENASDLPESLHDITVGSNGACSKPLGPDGVSGCTTSEQDASCNGSPICLAGTGYDGPTGVGTPDGIGAFEATGAAEAPPVAEEPEPVPPASPIGEAKPGSPTVGVPGPSATAPYTGAPLIPALSSLSLTRGAIIALNRSRPKVSQLNFSFTISTIAQVRVTLARRIRVKKRGVWHMLPDSLTITALKGFNSHGLRGHNVLVAGNYELTLTPVHGSARSLTFQIG